MSVPFTMARLLRELDTRGSSQLWGTVVVVDEAAMVGTRQPARRLDHAGAAHAKVVLVGDPAQLPEIEAGGAFAALAPRLESAELLENRRQHDPAERVALAHLRAGDSQAAVSSFVRAGRITMTDTADQARAQTVADWRAAVTEATAS